MEWLKDLIKNNPFTSLLFPTGLGALTFVGNLAIALADGKIDSNELHQLMSGATGIETVFLLIIMSALKGFKAKKR